MRITARAPSIPDVCDERRPRRFGYQLRCLEPAGHDGPHRWTPELAGEPSRRDATRPPIRRATASAVGRLARFLD
jgi:hypothetical protein